MSDILIAVVAILVTICIVAWITLNDGPRTSIGDVKPKDPWEQVNLKATKSGRWIECERPNYPAPPRPRTVSPSKPEGWK